jgi:hypothetical protein
MKSKFGSIHIELPDRDLASFHLDGTTQLKVMAQSVWLTHSLDNRDYFLHAGDEVELQAGLVLMEPATHAPARVTLTEAQPSSALAHVIAYFSSIAPLGQKTKPVRCMAGC